MWRAPSCPPNIEAGPRAPRRREDGALRVNWPKWSSRRTAWEPSRSSTAPTTNVKGPQSIAGPSLARVRDRRSSLLQLEGADPVAVGGLVAGVDAVREGLDERHQRRVGARE